MALQLEELVLTDNALRSIDDEGVCRLPKLRRLFLRYVAVSS